MFQPLDLVAVHQQIKSSGIACSLGKLVDFLDLQVRIFNKFEIIHLLLILSSLHFLISSQFLITKCLIWYVLCKEKLGVDN